MTGEATDLVARLRAKRYVREAWDEPYGTYSQPCDADDYGAEAINRNPDGSEAAALIEVQAAEIEGFKAWVSDALAVLTTIAGAETPPQQHGHYLAHRTAVKAARAFLASRTERADG